MVHQGEMLERQTGVYEEEKRGGKAGQLTIVLDIARLGRTDLCTMTQAWMAAPVQCTCDEM